MHKIEAKYKIFTKKTILENFKGIFFDYFKIFKNILKINKILILEYNNETRQRFQHSIFEYIF